MIRLQVQQSGLTYEGELSPPVPALIDAPGSMASALVAKFEDLGMSLADLTIDEDSLEERGLTCEIEELNASVRLRADSIEVRFSSVGNTGDNGVVDAISRVWQLFNAAAPAISAKWYRPPALREVLRDGRRPRRRSRASKPQPLHTLGSHVPLPRAFNETAPNVRREAVPSDDLTPGKREQEWLQQHWQEFVGRWVALDGSRLVAEAAGAREAAEKARAFRVRFTVPGPRD